MAISEKLLKKIHPKIEEISLEISDIQYKCYRYSSKLSGGWIGVISYSGTYRFGSGGKPDATFIQWKVDEFSDMGISGLVVDFTELDYQWGDDFSVNAYKLTRRNRPVRVVIKPKEADQERYDAFAWALGASELRTNLEEACREVENTLKEQQDAKRAERKRLRGK